MAGPARSASRNLISPRFSLEGSRPASLQPSQLPYIDEVTAKLKSGEFKLETSACPCGETASVIISEVDRYGLPLDFVLCTACGTIRANPYLDSSSLEDFYTRYFQKMYARVTDVDAYFARQRILGKRILASAQAWLKPGGRVYEVGCGAGGALDFFQSQGYEVAGCDYSAELIAAGTERGVKNLFYGSLKDIQTDAEDSKADLIYLNHVFEHMNNPLGFLEECRTRLTPEGRIVIIVPDVSRIDSFVVPAGDLLQFLHIAHKYNFSWEGLRQLGRRAGYRVRRLEPDPQIKTAHSMMPELWVELTMDAESAAEPATTGTRRHYGDKMMKYLRRNERLFSLGLCRAQIASRLSPVKKSIEHNLGRARRATPAKIVRKIRGRI